MVRTLVSLLGVLAATGQPESPPSAKPAGAPETAARSPTSDVRVDGGVIRGLLVGEKRDVQAFKGIPYAAPPVGERRWKAPQPVIPWQGTRDCFEFGAACPQQGMPPFLSVPEMAIRAPFSEDCLYLNVWVPALHERAARPLPVLYWVHGGAFAIGAASQPLYDGEELARLGCIVVSVNYRLGLFGFLAHPALSRENPDGVSGNYGLLDQLEGLRWVKRNIAAFGGDPNRVALCGESAGGISVLCLMAAPQASGLFRGAIAQSAPWMELLRLREVSPGREPAEQVGQRLIAACGLDASADTVKMRALEARVLILPDPSGPAPGAPIRLKPRPFEVGPIVDGRLIPEQPNQRLASGRAQAVPLIVGNTRDEMTMMVLGMPMPADTSAYTKALEREFGDQAGAVAAAYPVREAGQIRPVILQLMNDLSFAGEARFAARAHAAAGQDTFRYQFSRGTKRGLLAAMGAHHGAELAYLFQRPVGRVDQSARRVSRALGLYWIHFAATGNPNGPGVPEWPASRSRRDAMIDFAEEIHIVSNPRNAQSDLVENLHGATTQSVSPMRKD